PRRQHGPQRGQPREGAARQAARGARGRGRDRHPPRPGVLAQGGLERLSLRLRILVVMLVLVTTGPLAMALLVRREARPHVFGATEDSLAETAVVLASLVEADTTDEGPQMASLRQT